MAGLWSLLCGCELRAPCSGSTGTGWPGSRGLSVRTSNGSEASTGVTRSKVHPLLKAIAALGPASAELIGDGAISGGGGHCAPLKTKSVSARTDRNEDFARSMLRAA